MRIRGFWPRPLTMNESTTSTSQVNSILHLIEFIMRYLSNYSHCWRDIWFDSVCHCRRWIPLPSVIPLDIFSSTLITFLSKGPERMLKRQKTLNIQHMESLGQAKIHLLQAIANWLRMHNCIIISTKNSK